MCIHFDKMRFGWLPFGARPSHHRSLDAGSSDYGVNIHYVCLDSEPSGWRLLQAPAPGLTLSSARRIGVLR
jgi:hypothetical protein